MLGKLTEGASFIHWGSGPAPCKGHTARISELPPALEALCPGTLGLHCRVHMSPSLPLHLGFQGT